MLCKNLLAMVLIVILIANFITIGFTNPLLNNDYLRDQLDSAALQVIQMHSNAGVNQNGCGLNAGPDPDLIRQQKITEMVKNLNRRLDFQQKYFNDLAEELKFAIRRNGNPIVITSQLIRNLTALNGITSSHIQSLTNIFWQNSKLTANDLKYKIQDLIRLIQIIGQRIAKVIQTTGEVVLRNKPSLISGHKIFVGHNEMPFLNTSSVNIGFIDRQDVRHVMNNLYRKSRPQVVKGSKHVIRPTFVRHSLNSSHINGIEFHRQMVTTNTQQIIKSKINFIPQLTITSDLTLRGKLNGLDIDRDLVFLNRPEAVPTPKTFTSPLIIAQNVRSLTIDGIDLTAFSRNVLLSNGLQTINSKLILMKHLTTKSISIDGMFNNIDISAMATQLVYKNRPVTVRGKKFFILDNIHIKNHLFIGKTLDGQRIPNDLFLKNRNQIITAAKHFRGNTRFEGGVVVNGLVNGLRFPQDIVTLTRNETIIGPLVFGQSISVNADIDARRRVDGIDLSELKLYSLKMNDRLIRSDVHFNKGVTVGAIDLDGNVNDINLNKLFNEVVFLDNPNVEIIGTKTFESNVFIKQLFVDDINGIKLSDLVTTAHNETIISPKVFADFTVFNGIALNGLVRNINIGNLYNNRISLTKPEIITGIKRFTDPLEVNDRLFVTRINGIIPEKEFVLKSKPQEIIGAKIFRKDFVANKVIARNPMSVKGRIDKNSINELNSRAIRLNGYQTLPLSLILVNSNASFVDVYKDLNGIDIRKFANNVMSLTKAQVVEAPKFFNKEQTFLRIESFKGISGISLKDLNRNAVHLNGMPNQITAPFVFTHPVVIEKPLIVMGGVNGVNLSYIAFDAVYKTGKNLITGQNDFKSGFQVNGNIHSFTFNGIDLSNELLTNTRDHIIRGKVKFTKSLAINTDVVVDGRVNGLDLSEFSKNVMKTNTRNIISGSLELTGTIKVLADLKITGKINGINLNDLFNNAFFLNSDQEITGIKTIRAPIHLMKSLNTTSLNGINIPQFLDDIVFINSQKVQLIYSPKIFKNDIISNGLIQSKGFAIMRSINGVNLEKLNSQSIKTNQNSILRTIIRFNDLVIITNNFTQVFGRINGIDLLKDVIHLHNIQRMPQQITGRKVFQHLIINDNILVKGLVNGFPLKAIELNTFFATNDQKIMGHKIVNGLLEFFSAHNRVGSLNGLRIPEDFVTLNDNQTLSSRLTFNNPLFVNKNLFIGGHVSGENLTKLATESLLRDSPQVLSQPIKFDTIVFKRDVTVDQSVDNVDLSALSNEVKKFTTVANISKDLSERKANRHQFISDYLFMSLEKSIYRIDSFIFHQNLDEIHGNHIDVLGNGLFILSEILETPATIHSIKYNQMTEHFEAKRLNENPKIIHKPFLLNGTEFIVHLSPHSSNFSAHITRYGQLIAPIGPFISFVEILKINERNALIISFQSNTGKLLVHSLETQFNNKIIFTPITESTVGLGTSKMIAFFKDNIVHIVVAKHYAMNCGLESRGTLIFVLRNYRTLELIQMLPLMSIVDVVHFQNYGKHYLALSDGTSVDTSLNPQTIYIYRNELMREKCGFALFQKLLFDNTIQLSAFTFGTIHSERQFLLAANSTKILVWEQKGESGFTDPMALSTNSARVVAPIMARDVLYLVVGQSYKCHQSIIFRAETEGIPIAPVVFKDKYS